MASADQWTEPAVAAAAPARADLAVVGAGIVGLAVARELIARNPRASVCVLERERELATHQTGHSSGVIHSGIYYAPGSLKARLCVEGARELYEYCDRRAIPARRSGKLIVALSPRELPRLDELERRARANGVPGVQRLSASQITAIEPHARGIAALHSPSTGVVDFGAVARSLAHDVLATGGTIATGCEVTGMSAGARSLRLTHTHGDTTAGHAICCAGAWSDRLAVAASASADPRIVPFRGAYLRLAPPSAALVRALIYPVPDQSLPFLGVHLTRDIRGEVLIGPTALIALSRAPGSSTPARARDALSTLAWPGTWRVLGRWWKTGLTELRHAAQPAALARAAARYVPDIRSADARPAFAGIRAQALARDGRLIDDFAFSATERALHVRNAPSPAATSALAIARHVADEAQRAFGLSC
ncbi:MAG TPA: L-2-hydroxyglutarate oxidase [Solirubrobacteraceae bacterium]|nr:L-2-hydroxyglutarate oxidase [Solirubrobacteraceae bacterium]